MTPGVVTFDFHDTLVDCDDWFQLEIRELAPAVLDWAAAEGFLVDSSDRYDEARNLYRGIRADVMATGREQDASSAPLPFCIVCRLACRSR